MRLLNNNEDDVAPGIFSYTICCLVFILIILVISFIAGIVLVLYADLTLKDEDKTFLQIAKSKELEYIKPDTIVAFVLIGITFLNWMINQACHKKGKCMAFLEMLHVWGIISTSIALFIFQVRLMKTQTDQSCEQYKKDAIAYMAAPKDKNVYNDILIYLGLSKNSTIEEISKAMPKFVDDHCKHSNRYIYRAVGMGLISPFYLLIFICTLFAPCMPCIVCTANEKIDFYGSGSAWIHQISHKDEIRTDL